MKHFAEQGPMPRNFTSGLQMLIKKAFLQIVLREVGSLHDPSIAASGRQRTWETWGSCHMSFLI